MKDDQLTDNFFLHEFAVSSSYPDIASDITFDANETLKLFYLSKFILQPVRDIFGEMSITSGKRTPTLNVAINGSKTSQHLLCEATDWVFTNGDKKLLMEAYAFIMLKLQHNWQQVILYLTDDYKPRFIHVSIPGPVSTKKSQALINHKGNFRHCDDKHVQELYAKLKEIL